MPLSNLEEKTMATRKEEFKINGEDLIKKVKELVAQGNVRRIIIKNKDGKSLIEVPLSFGVAGMAALAVVAPALAAVGAIAALVTECSIVVEREDGPDAPAAGTAEGEIIERPADKDKSTD
jgi:hypothetical protein